MKELTGTWTDTVLDVLKLQRDTEERLKEAKGSEDRMKATLSSD